jgi:hypothetical protein
MKMASGLFWGIVLILIGLGIVIRIVFNIDFPIIKILIALFLIWLGIRILIGDHGILHFRTSKNDVIFGENSYRDISSENKEYNVIFGKAVFDFRDLKITEKISIQLNSIFGGAEVKINKGTPYRIKVESVFGGVNLPNGNTTVFGTGRYQSANFNPDSAHLFIKADVMFGGLQIVEY